MLQGCDLALLSKSTSDLIIIVHLGPCVCYCRLSMIINCWYLRRGKSEYNSIMIFFNIILRVQSTEGESTAAVGEIPLSLVPRHLGMRLGNSTR